MRSEVSKNNEYWIPADRYYELVHFCFQYPRWVKALSCIDSMAEIPKDVIERVQTSIHADPVWSAMEAREYYNNRIRMVEAAAFATDKDIKKAIVECVTNKNMSYDKIQARGDYYIPYSKHVFYQKVRQFFWVLSQLRG